MIATRALLFHPIIVLGQRRLTQHNGWAGWMELLLQSAMRWPVA
ncbi:MAG: hypothetical protein ACUVSS_15725 [Anaerolineae bacterium]